jgi:thiamine pyrophosphokinase
MRAFIYVGGSIAPEYITERPSGDDLIIAADSGLKNADALGVRAQIVVGDFDSYPEHKLPRDAEIIRLKPEKDLTDTQVAVELALERGASSIVIIGGLAGRLDHSMANLAILEDLHLRGVYAQINDGNNRVRFVSASSELIGRSGFKYFSVVAVSDVVKGLSIEGAKYPLKNAKLTRRSQFAVSNEIVGNCVLISLKKGSVFIIESREA